jgi:FkbM family methyltransferase
MDAKSIRRLVPKTLRQRLRSIAAYPRTWRVASDLESFGRIRRLENSTARWEPHVQRVPIRLRPLAGAEVEVRSNTSDIYVLRTNFEDLLHVPPASLEPGDVRVIWDLGANIGLTVAHLAVLFPDASLLGVELNRENAELCRENTRAWADRCQILQAAVWHEDGEVGYEHTVGHEHGTRATVTRGQSTGELAPAYSLNTLLADFSPGVVDYMKMDIEGAEQDVLRRNTEWAESVRVIKVEVHPPYHPDECGEDLRRLGFQAEVGERRHGPVTGTRAF